MDRETFSKKYFFIQPLMIPVCYALLACLIASVYYFGLRSLVVTLVVLLFGIAAEGIFTLRQGRPITSAVLVSCLIFAMSLPPTIPFWMAAVGIVFGIVFGKMVFGGFGFNVFNPAMVGRCFIYITFPLSMTNRWVEPLADQYGGFMTWFPSVDALTTATPLQLVRQGNAVPLTKLFTGSISGSLGETCAWLIILGGIYIIIKKSAPWRLAVSCLLGGFLMSTALSAVEVSFVPDPLTYLFAGSFLFGTFFVVTEPVTGPKQKISQWIYGFLIGGLTIVLRRYSNFSEGMMFAVLFMNVFVPITDFWVVEWKQRRKS
jgi:Na+-transporting NADH:ubiquinone oxidoreductase subunit B